MKKISQVTLILLISFASSALGQGIVLSGNVTDQKTKEPLANATISIIGKSIGTVANAVGEFEFFVPSEYANDTLFISFLGYKTFKQRVGILDNLKSHNFALEPESTLLAEVAVTVGQNEPKQIIENALKAVPSVYPSKPYLMKAFQRSWEKLDFVDSTTHPGKLLESSAVIYDPGYLVKKSGKNNEEVYVEQLRRTKLTEGWVNRGSTEDMSKEVFFKLMRDNQVKYQGAVTHGFLKGFFKFPNDLVYELESTTRFDNEYVDIIKINIPNGRSLSAYYRLFVSQQDFAILRFELYGKQEVNLSGLEYQTVMLEQTYIFRRYGGNVYLNYAKYQYKLNRIDRNKKKLLQVEDYFREILINDLITADVTEQRTIYQKAADAPHRYDKEFWKNYNIIQDNPLDKELVAIFEKGGRLESQFEKADYKKSNKKTLKND